MTYSRFKAKILSLNDIILLIQCLHLFYICDYNLSFNLHYLITELPDSGISNH